MRVPTYNLLVIAASFAIAVGLGLFLERTRIGRIVRATAENRDMAEGLGVNASRIFALVFTLGCMLGTVGGALVVPSGAASLDMAVELVVESFAVVVIGGLGSMRGALVGALVVGLMRAAAISLDAGTRDALGLPRRRPRADCQASRLVREGDGVSNPSIDIVLNPVTRRAAPRPNGLWVLLGLIVIMAAMPLVASPYALLLMLPFIGYSIALLGFNLLFGNTGLLSFGHALFLGVGAYTRGGADVEIRRAKFRTDAASPAALASGLISLVVGSSACATRGYSSAC